MIQRIARSFAVLMVAVAVAVGAALAAEPAAAPSGELGRLPSLAPLIEKVAPAVVNIAVMSKAPMEENPLLRDPFFRRFFNLPETPPVRPVMSAGSGVIVDAAQGYVLTNNHVIRNAEEITVGLRDRRKFKAKLIGSDPGTDIALLKIDAERLTALEFGDSDQLRVGDFVVAIGNPFALGQTVTSGIVSALGRSGLNVEGYEDFIQTDAPINPGNSGGALVNMKGELVGINTAIIGPGANIGIGFAVPSNMARAVMDQLIRYGEVRRGRIGIMVQDLTPDVAEAMKVGADEGAIVTQVEPGSAAEKADIRPGDVVVALDGQPVRGATDLRNRIGLMTVGREVQLTLSRNGERKTVTVRIAKAGEGEARAEGGPPGAEGEGVPQLAGAIFRNIEPGMPEYGKTEGVVAIEVAPGSPAWRNGLREGDVVVAVNREKVKSIDELRAALKKSKGGVITMDVIREGARVFIVIR